MNRGVHSFIFRANVVKNATWIWIYLFPWSLIYMFSCTTQKPLVPSECCESKLRCSMRFGPLSLHDSSGHTPPPPLQSLSPTQRHSFCVWVRLAASSTACAWIHSFLHELAHKLGARLEPKHSFQTWKEADLPLIQTLWVEQSLATCISADFSSQEMQHF